ncbi:phytanoyl-CoA dioxygenase family protein [Micromonospora sp. NPDC000663]|uniref:phytanoyl-CoA dioxygenase family protein n=1 Tax=Micromonospora TaxID=1873 RepID=UPI0036CCF5C1
MRAAFDEHGYLVISEFIDAATLTGLRAAADLAFDTVVGATLAQQAPHPRLTWWRLPDGRPYVFKLKPVADLAPLFGEVVASDAVLGVASAVLGGASTVMEDKITYKVPLETEAGWATLPVLGEEVRKHSDAAYFAARGFGRVLTVALCLDDCPAEAGALRVWPGSHHRPVAHVMTPEQGPVVPDESAPDHAAVTLEAAAGSLLAWDSALVHASDPNRTVNPRRLLVLGYTTGRP